MCLITELKWQWISINEYWLKITCFHPSPGLPVELLEWPTLLTRTWWSLWLQSEFPLLLAYSSSVPLFGNEARKVCFLRWATVQVVFTSQFPIASLSGDIYLRVFLIIIKSGRFLLSACSAPATFGKLGAEGESDCCTENNICLKLHWALTLAVSL